MAGADDHPLEQRFLASGIDTCHPGQKATVLTPQFRARILTATRKMPNDGSYALELPQLAAALRVSKDAVHRVWKEAGLNPHRLERYIGLKLFLSDVVMPEMSWNPAIQVTAYRLAELLIRALILL